ncbi:Bifunctional aspartokinase/homoserine dehydrogenase [Diplonema papillatum]|nr:Bifunctional aspartokinase/homoserine dehydrogenase [Diplonema papillatum]
MATRALEVAAQVERKRSVPKKSIEKAPVGQTQGVSLLPYVKAGTAGWSNTEFRISGLQGCVVLKFGGSSVGGKMGQVLEVIEKHAREGGVAVVVSAMGKTTDLLIDAADKACVRDIEEAHEIASQIEKIAMDNVQKHCADLGVVSAITENLTTLINDLKGLLLGISLVRELSPATLDRLLSFGERLSAVVVSSLLQANGTPAHHVDGKDWVVTDDDFGKAKVELKETLAKLTALTSTWPDASVPVVTGFLGATADGKRTTLGRNGSDYTATLIGLGLGASRVIINTDVPGVFTADPKIVKEAYPVPELSYVEAMELSIYGSRMFHPRTILPLVDQKIPMIIRNTDDPDGLATIIMDPGTHPANHKSKSVATCVTQLENLAVLSLRSRLGQPGSSPVQHIGLRLTQCLGAANVKIHHASFAANGQAVHVVISKDEAPEAQAALLEEFDKEIRQRELDEMNVWMPVTLLSLVRAPQTVVPKLFAALTAARVKVRSVGQGSDQSSSISCVIDAHDTAVAVRCAHTAINLGHQIVSLLILGNNSSSHGLLQRLADKAQEFLARYQVEFRVVGIFHTCGLHNEHNKIAAFNPTGEAIVEAGLPIHETLERLKRAKCDAVPAGKRMSSIVPARTLQRLRQMSCPMVVDTNRLDIEIVDFYKMCHFLGIDVIVSNASSIVRLGNVGCNGVSGSCSRESHADIAVYDTCVGASVPICGTIRMVNQMADRVVNIAGSLSGTCGLIASWLTAGKKFSEAVRHVMDKDFAEPKVVTDLSGLDVCRKLVVLGREMGQHLSVSDVKVTPLVDQTVLDAIGDAVETNEVVSRLEPFDYLVEAQLEGMRSEGLHLAYIAELAFSNGGVRATVAPQFVDERHPAISLSDTEIYVQIVREGNQKDVPLLLRGPGCGSSSALGLVGDILKTALKLRGVVY